MWTPDLPLLIAHSAFLHNFMLSPLWQQFGECPHMAVKGHLLLAISEEYAFSKDILVLFIAQAAGGY